MYSETKIDLPFETYIVKTEVALSMAAAIPVFGIIPGIIKIALSIIQMISASVAMLVFYAKDDVSKLTRARAHLINGAANFAAGFLEAIPFVGTAIAIYRVAHGWTFVSHYGHEFLIFAGYETCSIIPVIVSCNWPFKKISSAKYLPKELLDNKLDPKYNF